MLLLYSGGIYTDMFTRTRHATCSLTVAFSNSPEPNLTHHSGPPPDMAQPRRLHDNAKRQAEENTYASLSVS